MIGINLYGPAQNSTLSSSTSAGYMSQTNWNNLQVVPADNGVVQSALTDNSGALTTAIPTYFGQRASGTTTGVNPGFTSGSGDALLFSSALFSGGNSFGLTVTNIPYTDYTIYVYLGENSSQPASDSSWTLTNTGTGTVNSTVFYQEFNASSLTPQGTYVLGTNTTPNSPANSGSYPNADYLEFTGNTANNFTLTGETLTGLPMLAGIQIVDTASAPEPSAYAILLGGMGMLLGLRALRRTA